MQIGEKKNIFLKNYYAKINNNSWWIFKIQIVACSDLSYNNIEVGLKCFLLILWSLSNSICFPIFQLPHGLFKLLDKNYINYNVMARRNLLRLNSIMSTIHICATSVGPWVYSLQNNFKILEKYFEIISLHYEF